MMPVSIQVWSQSNYGHQICEETKLGPRLNVSTQMQTPWIKHDPGYSARHSRYLLPWGLVWQVTCVNVCLASRDGGVTSASHSWLPASFMRLAFSHMGLDWLSAQLKSGDRGDGWKRRWQNHGTLLLSNSFTEGLNRVCLGLIMDVWPI